MVQNVATAMLHMSGVVGKLACGKDYPHKFTTFAVMPTEGPRCPRCFGTTARRI